MTRTVKTQGIILKKRNLLNRDAQITIFTKDSGKIAVMAKGLSKITSRRLPHIQTGNLINMIVYRKGERFYLQETQLISIFSQIKSHKNKVNQLYFILFILDRLLPQNQDEFIIYKILLDYMKVLSSTVNPDEKLIMKYLNQLLVHFGYSKKELTLFEAVSLIEETINESLPQISFD